MYEVKSTRCDNVKEKDNVAKFADYICKAKGFEIWIWILV